MNQILKTCLVCCAVFSCLFVNGQNDQFRQLYEIQNGDQAWNTIMLSDEVLRNTKRDLSDIRIWHFNPEGDTLEAPYFIEELKSKTIQNNLVSSVINERFENGVYSFVLALDAKSETPLTRTVKLGFNDQNFHWFATIRGSQDLKVWQLISEKNELVAVSNQYTDYKFTTLNFEPVQYAYIKVEFACDQKPDLSNAQVSFYTKESPKRSAKNVHALQQEEDEKQSVISLALDGQQLINTLNIGFEDTIDYYRRISVDYLYDVIQTEKGEKEVYKALTTALASSAEPCQFNFENVLTNKLKLTIANYDDLPLTVNQAQVFGSLYKLTYRGIGSGTYAIAFKNDVIRAPNYDLNNFRDNVPQDIPLAKIGKQMPRSIETKETPSEPSDWWLWLILIPAVLLMGWFSVKMMKSANE
jgi:hypothetical protein